MIVTLDSATHTYYQDGQKFNGPSVTQALAHCGLVDFSFVEQEIRERAMQRGTSVHWLLALHDQGALDYRRVPKALRPYRKAYLNWRANSGFAPFPEYIERSFVSPMGFCGTVDRIGDFPWVDGKRTSPAVVDFKSGSSIHPATAVQLALYAYHFKVFRRIALRLSSDETYSVKEFPISELNLDIAKGFEAIRRWQPQQ